MQIKSLTLAAIAAGIVPSISLLTAAETADDRTVIVVTAERRDTELDRSPANISVVSADDDRLSGYRLNPWQWLTGLPGVDVAPRGSLDGGVPRVRIRGTNSYDVQYQMDGIPVTDPTDTQGRFGLAGLNPAGLDRMEVVRGSQGGVYGSQAVGGVVNMLTARPTPTTQGQIRMEGGSFNTGRLDGQISGPITGSLGFALGVSGLTTTGITARTDANSHGDPNDHEADPIQRGGANLRLEWRPHATQMVYAAISGTAVNQSMDEGDNFSDPQDDQSTSHQRMGRVSAGSVNHLSDHLQLATDFAYTSVRRTYYVGANPSWGYPSLVDDYLGDDAYASIRARWQIQPWCELATGADGHRETLRQNPDDQATASGYGTEVNGRDWLGGVWGQTYSSGTYHELTASIRRDAHSREAEATTWRLAGACFLWQDHLKPHASIGTGFRAPSLYETFSTPYGNPALEAQRSRSWDAGLRGMIMPGVSLDSTYFRTDYQSLITFVDPDGWLGPNPGSYSNIDGYSVHGVENGLDVQPAGCPVFARASYTWQTARELPAGVDDEWSIYLPRHHGAASGGIRDQWGWAQIEAIREGGTPAGWNGTSQLDWYTLVNLSAGWTINRTWEIHARIENLLNQPYETTPGFANPLRAYYGGVTATF